ncbi:MAG: GNAT family N-acetyltransferase [bacterium]
MDSIIIRKAKKEDVETIVAMRIAIQKHLEKIDPETWRFSEEGYAMAPKEIRFRLESKACCIAIAETTGGAPVGMVMAEIVKNSGVVPEMYGHIHWLYVREPARRLGIGKRLIQYTSGFFETWNIEFITVGYVVKNPEAAAFWPSAGFKPRVMHAYTTREKLNRLTEGMPPAKDI